MHRQKLWGSFMAIDLFSLQNLTEDQLHPYFKILNTEDSYLPAKELLKIISQNYNDIDGNFVKAFQTEAFDQRFFELYIYCLLKEEYFTLNREYKYPDFVIEDENGKVKFGLEVTSINSKKSVDKIPTTINPLDITIDINGKIQRWARLLDTKLNHTIKINGIEKHYWELDHLKDKPFILAVNDFQGFLQMTWSFEFLLSYCYGLDDNYNTNGLLPNEVQKDLKQILKKEINLRFFSQPGAEYISAIIVNPSATLSKFNRMGKERGYGKKNIDIYCTKSFYDIENDITVVHQDYLDDSVEISEKFTDGLIVLKNPNAVNPIYDELFPESLQFSEENGHLKVFSYNKLCLYNCEQINLHLIDKDSSEAN